MNKNIYTLRAVNKIKYSSSIEPLLETFFDLIALKQITDGFHIRFDGFQVGCNITALNCVVEDSVEG